MTPFEVIFETTNKTEYTPESEPTPKKSSYLEFSFSLLLNLKIISLL